MRQAIFTKYLGATNLRGSRVKATAEAGPSITVHWDDALDVDENHAAAAKALARKLGWHGRYFAGALKDGNVYVSVGSSDLSHPEVQGGFDL
jgi:hypothetical protein